MRETIMKKMGINVVAQMIAWGIFTLTDYYEKPQVMIVMN